VKIEVDTKIDHPREVVFKTLRDRLPEIVEYMPNITAIDVVERHEPRADVVEFVNVWRGDASIPSLAKPFIKPDMIRWTDYAIWDESEWICDWRTETAFMTDRVDCSGRNRYEEVDGGIHTRLLIDGELNIDTANFPGVPKLVARRAAPVIEKFIVGLITPNLKGTAKAVNDFLNAEQS
jgi:hypothetical protein